TATGSNMAAQYNPPLREEFEDATKTPDQYLLFFHHVPWNFKTHSGRSLWDELVARYRLGVTQVGEMQKTWSGLGAYVDKERFDQVSAFLVIQNREAIWWRDACLAYFQQYSKQPFPTGYAPKYPLSYYEAMPPNTSPDP
ncbi:MAG TPA: hypothetical protein VII48_12900, partial [Rhizomicrobium sp.]